MCECIHLYPLFPKYVFPLRLYIYDKHFVSYQQRRHEYLVPCLVPQCQQHLEGRLWSGHRQHQRRSPAPPHLIRWEWCRLVGCLAYRQPKGLIDNNKKNHRWSTVDIFKSLAALNPFLPISEPFKNRATPSRTPTHRARMKGLRRPHCRTQRSLAEPIRGVKRRPRMGLRNQVKL